ncbi:hypothetical protein EON63_03510 [archaeon]|nr:MAG: hypothetical protein EON63_03510 [archaeon]
MHLQTSETPKTRKNAFVVWLSSQPHNPPINTIEFINHGKSSAILIMLSGMCLTCLCCGTTGIVGART